MDAGEGGKWIMGTQLNYIRFHRSKLQSITLNGSKKHEVKERNRRVK
jgi:hypothetical protein